MINFILLQLLHIGCGTGNYTVAVSQFVGHVTGLELNEGMLARAAEKTASLKNVTVMQGDITNMPFPDDHFDAICCNLVSLPVLCNYFQWCWV